MARATWNQFPASIQTDWVYCLPSKQTRSTWLRSNSGTHSGFGITEHWWPPHVQTWLGDISMSSCCIWEMNCQAHLGFIFQSSSWYVKDSRKSHVTLVLKDDRNQLNVKAEGPSEMQEEWTQTFDGGRRQHIQRPTETSRKWEGCIVSVLAAKGRKQALFQQSSEVTEELHVF